MTTDAPECLDLFAGGGGCSEGYRRAGYRVTMVDFVERQHRPEGVAFIKADVREILTDLDFLRRFDLIHASPPCKVHTRLGHLVAAQGKKPIHGDLVGPTRDALEEAGVPYIIENVEGAPLRPDVLLCGSMFPDLVVVDDFGARRWLRRHRLFELGGWGNLGWDIQPEPCCKCQSGCSAPMCAHRRAGDRPLGVYGTAGDQVPDGGETATLEQARILMGAPWMSWAAITQAIPPAYTEYLGRKALAEIGARVDA